MLYSVCSSFLVVPRKLKHVEKRNLIRLCSTYTEMVKKKRARAHTDLIAKAKNNFACGLQDPIQRGKNGAPGEHRHPMDL